MLLWIQLLLEQLPSANTLEESDAGQTWNSFVMNVFVIDKSSEI
jgi:hypothetical protein